ncbi:MAG TPA: diaminopimelate epimerase [Acidimicrobiales bacterium]|nr:diaminopimelate epimerase [Acidimicrobiales bacterium]
MHLTKHHGLGNDFLVLLDLEGTRPIDAEMARALCDRRRGVGADGLIRVTSGADGADVVMELRNSDGSEAEMSGNGIRCLGQAVARARGVTELDLLVATDGGSRRLAVIPGADDRTVSVEVDMGEVREGPARDPDAPAPSPAPLEAVTLDLGNPHLVLLVDDPWAVAIETEGPALEAHHPQGINVEWVAPVAGRPDTIGLRVWERGAGVTEACGTGACAAAHAANRWGLVGKRVTVEMPGGAVEVVLAGDGATLVGPATYVATIEVPWP